MADRQRLKRRALLEATVAAGGAAAVGAVGLGCDTATQPHGPPSANTAVADPVLSIKPLGFPWATSDPFLFCAYHNDTYPVGNEVMGPAGSLAGRNIGSDFGRKDGWSMYHGNVVPGFPQHPHRGFETITIARRGLVDHSDSLGATARYGHGDVQWMTAGRGIVHAEMFPLLEQGRDNPLELFQVWLNLPARDKMVAPHFKMLWSKTIPQHVAIDDAGRKATVAVIAGTLADQTAPAPPPKSWAAQAQSDVAIYTIAMDPNAKLTLPAAKPGTQRTLYFFRGASVTIAQRTIDQHAGVHVRAESELTLTAGADGAELLMLQGQPIGEPVARRGPFVMNTEAELRQAYADYRSTGFGGWPWSQSDPVHDRTTARFAKHVDGRVEKAT